MALVTVLGLFRSLHTGVMVMMAAMNADEGLLGGNYVLLANTYTTICRILD